MKKSFIWFWDISHNHKSKITFQNENRHSEFITFDYLLLHMPTSKTAIWTNSDLDFDLDQFQATGNWPRIAKKWNSVMQNLCNWQIVPAEFNTNSAL